MTGTRLLEALRSPAAAALFTKLYGETAAALDRYLSLAAATLRDFPETATDLRVFTAAGRTELGGNHTDHNHGKVLAASIQLDAIAFAAKRNDRRAVFRSTGYPDVSVDLSDLSVMPTEIGTTEALVRGIAAEFTARGFPVGGFTANAASTVLSGSGLSSSAAVEVLIATIFNGLYVPPDRALPAVELAKIGQKAENLYFGKPCGLMDQVASASGGAVAIDFIEPGAPLVTAVDFDLSGAGYALCVVDTGGSHADLTSEYAAVPAEMKAVAALFGGATLRDVSRVQLLNRTAELRLAVGDRALLRAMHFFDENDRVDGMLTALQTANAAGSAGRAEERDAAVERFLNLVELSGRSSWELLQNVSTPKFPKEQGVALALALSREFFASHPAIAAAGKRGVCRVHGGGFAGTIQTYLPTAAVSAYAESLSAVFGPRAVTTLRIRPIGAAELNFGVETEF